jgi:choline-glycine betaine transporter
MASPMSVRNEATSTDGRAATYTAAAHRSLRETKPSFMTTEFWAMVAGLVALVVLYNVTDNPDMTLWRTCLLMTVIASAYIVSRGWAKSGSHADHWESDNRSRG